MSDTAPEKRTEARRRQSLRLVLLTRTGRPSGLAVARALMEADKNLVCVIAERRASLLAAHGPVRAVTDALRRHGPGFVIRRGLWAVRGRFHRPGEDLAGLCARHQVMYELVDNHNGEECGRLLAAADPDLIVTANTRILTPHVLERARKGGINYHSSLLPAYAGLDSIFWALYHGEARVGVTIHRLEPGLDTGDIVCQQPIEVRNTDTVETLTRKAVDLGARLMVQAVTAMEAGDFSAAPQDLRQRTVFSWPTPSQRRELARRLARRAREAG